MAEGDLSERARRRAEELAYDANLRTRAPRDPAASGSAEVKARTATGCIPVRKNGAELPAWLYVVGDRWTGTFKALTE